MIFFDYIFYRISNIYVITGLDKADPDAYGGGIISLFQCFNLISVLHFLFSVTITKPLIIAIVLLIFISNAIFVFTERKFKKCKEIWDDEPKKNRRLKGVLIIIYLVVSFGLFLWALISGRSDQISG